jgi:hypothetical protein
MNYRTENLCVIGMKVEEKEVWLVDNEIGTQTQIALPRSANSGKDILIGRGSLRAQKFFNMAPMKENSFLMKEYSLRR